MNVYQDQLETLIDKIGLEGVLSAIVAICNDKASHLSENWQDDKLAKVWEKNGYAVERAMSKVSA